MIIDFDLIEGDPPKADPEYVEALARAYALAPEGSIEESALEELLTYRVPDDEERHDAIMRNG